MEAVRLILAFAPLQIVLVPAVVTIGAGLTVTVILVTVPRHEPLIEVGVTIYSTVPEVAALGLVRI